MRGATQTDKTISVNGSNDIRNDKKLETTELFIRDVESKVESIVDTKEINVMKNSTINKTRTAATKTNLPINSGNVDYENNLSIYSADIGEYPILTAEEEKELGLRILDGDKSAQNTLVNHNLRLGVSLAKNYASSYKLDINDLIQQANIGLMMAAAKFDYNKGRFSTIAVRYCKAYISKYVKKFITSFSISEHDNEDLSRIRTIRKEYVDTYEEEPTVEKVVEIFNSTVKSAKKRITIEKADALLCAIYTKSIDSTVGEDGCTVEDLVADKSVDVEAEVESNYTSHLWEKAINELDIRKAIIVRLHVGVGCDELSYSQIGKRLKLTGERVRQLFDEACEEIANGPYSEKLRDMVS